MAANRNRTFVYRLMIVLVAGLIAVTAVLDIGFRALQSRLVPADDPWQATAITTIERALADVPPSERRAAAELLGAQIGVPIQLLQPDAVSGVFDDARTVAGDGPTLAAAGSDPARSIEREPIPRTRVVKELETDDGRRVWLAASPALNAVLRLGPVSPPPEPLWPRFVPPLFYLAIAVLVFVWLRPLMKDLDTITESTRRFAADYREHRPTAPSVGNLAELAENYDAMAERLRGLIQGQKELTSALSHEMRTPLARIRMALGLLNEQAGKSMRDDLAAIETDVQEVDRLISTMLNYARLDHPDTQMQWSRVPAAAWLGQIVEKVRLPGREVTLMRVSESAELCVDPKLMELAVSNLVVNACRHAAATVTVEFTESGESQRLVVEDDGPGIPLADRTSVFKAFTRLDDSRSRDTGGFGLGLAIVARIAALHGGTVTAGESTALGGAAMTLTWPTHAL